MTLIYHIEDYGYDMFVELLTKVMQANSKFL